MHYLFTSAELQEITRGLLMGGKEWQSRRIIHDSRDLSPGDIFIAIKGKNFDGHAFISDAIAKGVVALIVETAIEGWPCLVVKNTTLALGEIAARVREKINPTIIAITGSAGKTTTKEMLAVSLPVPKIYKTPGNYNNHIGLPLSLINMPLTTKMAVIELGMNASGEIEYLSRIARPNIAVITNISAAHIGNFHSLAEIAASKAEILLGVEQGIAILDLDCPFYPYLKQKAGSNRVITFGRSNAEVCLKSSAYTESGMQIVVQIEKAGDFSFSLPVKGENFIHSALISIAVAYALALDLHTISFAGFEIQAGRGKIYQLSIPKKITLIDDCYNCSPAALVMALRNLRLFPGRKIAIIGEMKELGQFSKELHLEALGSSIAHDTFCIPLGEEMKNACLELLDPQQILYLPENLQELINELPFHLKNGDTILVKAANSMNFKKIVEYLLNANGQQ